ncbi:MAG: MBL fold metallo-hydrolase [Pseudomonadota bacterium]|nr:MBL fold metallo-hydrolase [Pseudomonadota bacterium]
MRTRRVTGLILAGAMAAGLQGASAGAAKQDYEAKEVGDGVYVVHGPTEYPNPQNRGFMNNPAFVVTDEGVVVVDPGSGLWVGEMVLEKIAAVTDKPVVAVFNTHVHGDHWLGNHAIRDKYPKAKIYGHPRMIERVGEGAGDEWVSSLERLTEGATKGTKVVAPDNAIDNAQSVTVGGATFEILHTGKSHTDNDIMIHLQPANILFLGDNVGYHRILRLDDGSFPGNIEAIDVALERGATTYVPGHGPTGGTEVPQAYRDYLNTLYEQVKVYYDEGLSDFEIKPEVLPKLMAWQTWSGFDDELGKHISLGYLEIEAAEF